MCQHVEQRSEQALKIEKKLEIAKNVIFPKGEEIILAAAHRNFILDEDVLLETLDKSQSNVSDDY